MTGQDPLASSGHTPTIPAWLCTSCGDPWPCHSKRQRLLAEFMDSLMTLHLFMAARMVDAADDLRDLPAGELRARFMGWFPRPSAAVGVRNDGWRSRAGRDWR